MRQRKVLIEEIDNGFLLSLDSPTIGLDREAYPTLDEIFGRLLNYFEFRNPRWEGDQYGRVVIERERQEHMPLEEMTEELPEIVALVLRRLESLRMGSENLSDTLARLVPVRCSEVR